MSAPLLQAEDLHLSFGGIKAADGVSLTVNPGERLAIIGPNGAGKTTFINMTTGYLHPQRGRIRLDGREITGSRELFSRIKRQTGDCRAARCSADLA